VVRCWAELALFGAIVKRQRLDRFENIRVCQVLVFAVFLNDRRLDVLKDVAILVLDVHGVTPVLGSPSDVPASPRGEKRGLAMDRQECLSLADFRFAL
jgi:hypothetical protein